MTVWASTTRALESFNPNLELNDSYISICPIKSSETMKHTLSFSKGIKVIQSFSNSFNPTAGLNDSKLLI